MLNRLIKDCKAKALMDEQDPVIRFASPGGSAFPLITYWLRTPAISWYLQNDGNRSTRDQHKEPWMTSSYQRQQQKDFFSYTILVLEVRHHPLSLITKLVDVVFRGNQSPTFATGIGLIGFALVE